MGNESELLFTGAQRRWIEGPSSSANFQGNVHFLYPWIEFEEEEEGSSETQVASKMCKCTQHELMLSFLPL